MDNGGPTLTHALLSGSPAVDAGDPLAVAGVDVTANDQRGVSRVLGRLDIGAVESLVLDVNSDSDWTLRRQASSDVLELIANGTTQVFSLGRDTVKGDGCAKINNDAAFAI